MRKDARDSKASGHATDDRDDVAAFVDAVRGVRKLSGPRRVSPSVGAADAPLEPSAARSVARLKMKVPSVGSGNTGNTDTTDPAAGIAGDHWTALGDGVDRRILRRLRAGDLPVEGRIDLHGLTRAKASAALARFIAAARTSGRRCLLVIHGRGLHSGGEGAALRDLVRNELATSTHAGNVLACATAAPAQGGSGATLVYLRR